MDIKRLYEPLEQKSRRGRGGDYNYVPWQDVAHRMNEVFDANWSSEVKSQEVIGPNVIIRVRVTAMDPTTSVLYHQEGFGGAVDREGDEAGNSWKAAYSKALRDACKKWGIGMYLDEDAGAPTPNVAATPPPVPSAPQAAAPATPSVPSAPAAPPVQPGPPAAPAMPNVPAPGVAETPATPAAPAAPAAPPIPPATPTPPAVPAPEMPMSSGSVLSNSDDNGGITEVQQIALEGILGMRDLNYEDLAKEAFENKGMKYDTIPKAEELTYEEAVVVVKFGNDKYRNK